jgi:hypothetical protein
MRILTLRTIAGAIGGAAAVYFLDEPNGPRRRRDVTRWAAGRGTPQPDRLPAPTPIGVVCLDPLPAPATGEPDVIAPVSQLDPRTLQPFEP